jgi:tetratricopeptide (TPR) repeat protein
MLVNRIWFISITAIVMTALLVLTKNPVLAGAITFIAVMAGYIIISYLRSKKRLDLLEEKCDPQAFLEATEKQRNITGRNARVNAYLNIDIAAGHMELGEFKKAKDILESIDKSLLSAKNGTLLVYTVNMISCLYELGEIASAEKIFETQIPILPPVNNKLTQVMQFFIADRFFYLNRFEESTEKYNCLLKEGISTRRRLETIYRLAEIDSYNGDIGGARQKYIEVAEKGHKLWSAVQARKRLESLL